MLLAGTAAAQYKAVNLGLLDKRAQPERFRSLVSLPRREGDVGQVPRQAEQDGATGPLVDADQGHAVWSQPDPVRARIPR